MMSVVMKIGPRRHSRRREIRVGCEYRGQTCRSLCRLPERGPWELAKDCDVSAVQGYSMSCRENLSAWFTAVREVVSHACIKVAVEGGAFGFHS